MSSELDGLNLSKDGLMQTFFSNAIVSKRTCLILLFVFKCFTFSAPVWSQGVLSRASRAVHASPEPEPASVERDDDSDSSSSALGSVVNSVFKSSGGRRRRESTRNRDRRRRQRNCQPGYWAGYNVVEHHYIHGPVIQSPAVEEPIPGTFRIDETTNDSVFQESVVEELSSDFENWGARLTAIVGSNFDQLNHGGLGLLLQSPGSLGLDASVTTFRESGINFREHLWLGDVNVVWEGVTGDVRGRIGIGVNWLNDSIGTEAGLNLTGGIDVKISERIIGAGEIDFGSLGSTDFFHTQLSLGYRFEKSEIVTGYDYYNIGGTGIDGWFVGLRIRY